MPKFLTAGIAGHVDHGKTSLVRCLTGIDTDRLQIEKERGLSIESGIAPMALSAGGQMALVDVPGHTDFFKNTVRGLSAVDLGILVVAADDGVMPQTVEHVQILRFFGAKAGLIVLSKADLVDQETLEMAELEIRELTEGTFLKDQPVIPFSTVDQLGLDEIRMGIEEAAGGVVGKDCQGPFRCWIDQVKGFPGFGTVASGTILSGSVSADDPLQLLPSGLETRARSIETHHQTCSRAWAGQRVGINLHRIPVDKVSRGMLLATPDSVQPTYLLNVVLEAVEGTAKPIRNRQRVKLYLGTSVVNTLVVLMEADQLGPGERGLAQFRLMRPVPAMPGDPFVICLLNVPTILAGGKVIEIPREKFTQARAQSAIPSLKCLQANDLKGFVDRVFEGKPLRPVASAELARATGFPVARVESELQRRIASGELISFKGRGVLRKAVYLELKAEIRGVVERILRDDPLKLSATSEEIRHQLAPSLDEAPFQRMCAELCDEGVLARVGASYKIPDLSVKVSGKREELIGRLLDYAEVSGLVPFSADTFWRVYGRTKLNKNEVQRLLDFLHAQGRLIRLNNRRFLSPGAMDRIKDRVRALILSKGELTVNDCKDVLGYGRTVGIPVFEYLDAIGFTERQGDVRVLKPTDSVRRG